MPQLTVAQAAALRRVTRMSVHRWIRAGLPATRLGSQYVIEQADLDAYKPRRAGNPTFGRKRKQTAKERK